MLPKRQKLYNSKTRQKIAIAELKQPLVPEDLRENKRRISLFTTFQNKQKRQACALFIFEHKIKIGCFLFFLAGGSLTLSYLSTLRKWDDEVNDSFSTWQQSYQKYLHGTCPSEKHSFWYHPERNIIEEEDKNNKRLVQFEQLYDYCGNSYEFAIQTVASLSSFFPEMCIGLMNKLCDAYKEYEENIGGRSWFYIEFIMIALSVALVVVPSSIFVFKKLGKVKQEEIAALQEILTENPLDPANHADLDVMLPRLESKINTKHNELMRKRCLEVLDIIFNVEENSLLGICQEIFEFADIDIEQPVELQIQKPQPSFLRPV